MATLTYPWPAWIMVKNSVVKPTCTHQTSMHHVHHKISIIAEYHLEKNLVKLTNHQLSISTCVICLSAIALEKMKNETPAIMLVNLISVIIDLNKK